ncbi:MAG: putative toxin-antitoxin system toxin component, PIN family [Cyclobacteriaceae bacterium]|nr:putative toxin-antitoxin system toxin component, PIN family [Cyclobacteriaceae bacterium]
MPALLKVVLDTNAVLRSISRRSTFSIVMDKLYNGGFDLHVTNDILLEYEEKISEVFSKETAELLLGAFTLLPNVKKTEVYYQLGLIHTDKDDNKFSDCAFAANAHYLVTNDRHFDVLKSIDFPVINIIRLEEFASLISN